jgi:hypothetical protein
LWFLNGIAYTVLLPPHTPYNLQVDYAQMSSRDRSRRAQLQALLGELGTVRAYVPRANGMVPTPGWYIELAPVFAARAKIADAAPPPPWMWMTQDGVVFAGLDMTHAAAAIERVRALTES